MELLLDVMPASLSKNERTALTYLPERIAREVKSLSALYGGNINEIRLRGGGVLSLTVRGENIAGRITVTREEIRETFRALCGRSVYSYGDTTRSGFVTTPEGIRAGICGSAVCDKGEISSVSSVSSICIRIPHRVKGCADYAYSLMKNCGFCENLLIWSKPGVGKTTLLRELTNLLATGEDGRRVALVDTRSELAPGIAGTGFVDVLSGYPRSRGIEIAKRTLSPQIIICDELSDGDDVSAVRDAVSAGITVVASAHAPTGEYLKENEKLRECIDLFGIKLGLLAQKNNGFAYSPEVLRHDA